MLFSKIAIMYKFKEFLESLTSCAFCGQQENDGMWVRKTNMQKFHYVCYQCVEKFFTDEIPTIVKKDSKNNE